MKFENGNEDKIAGMLNMIIEYDDKHDYQIKFDQLLPNGESFFTIKQKPMPHGIKHYVSFFIEKGVDPNVPNKYGIYPLEFAMETNSVDLFDSLIDSQRIDFSQKIRNKMQTGSKFILYLHLAAGLNNYKIFQRLINDNLIDINVEDENGETPLFEA